MTRHHSENKGRSGRCHRCKESPIEDAPACRTRGRCEDNAAWQFCLRQCLQCEMRLLKQLKLRAALSAFRNVMAGLHHLAGWKLFVEKIGQFVI
jgi:hypothetical protein